MKVGDQVTVTALWWTTHGLPNPVTVTEIRPNDHLALSVTDGQRGWQVSVREVSPCG